MLDNVITWLMKRLILLWDRHNDKLAFSFGRDERTDYSVLVERFYDDYYTVGTARKKLQSNVGTEGLSDDCF